MCQINFPHLQFNMMSNCHIYKIKTNEVFAKKLKKKKLCIYFILSKQFWVVCSLNVLCSIYDKSKHLLRKEPLLQNK